MLNMLNRTFDRIIECMASMSGVILIFIMLAVTLNIVLRKVFGISMHWVDEITAVSICYLGFLGAAWVLREDGHVTIDILIARLSPKRQRLLRVITSIFVSALCLALTYIGAVTTINMYQRGVFYVSVLELPMAALVAAIPIGCFFLFIQGLRTAYSLFRTPGKGEETAN